MHDMLEMFSNDKAYAALTALNVVTLVVNTILFFRNRRLLDDSEATLLEIDERFRANAAHSSEEAANGKGR